MRDGQVTDATRLERLAPTLTELVDKGAVVVVASHFGRPKGERNPEMSLAPLAGPLSGVLGGRNVAFADDCIGPDAKKVVAAAKEGDIVLLENLRFHAGEEANDSAFARVGARADLGATCLQRIGHTSMAALPAQGAVGRQCRRSFALAALGNPERLVGAIVGGAKISTKLDLLGNLVEKVRRSACYGVYISPRARH